MKVHYKALALTVILFISCKNKPNQNLKKEVIFSSKQVETPIIASKNLSFDNFINDLKNSIKANNDDNIKSCFYFPLSYIEEISDGLDSGDEVKKYNNYLEFRNDISVFKNSIEILKVATSKTKINDSTYEFTLNDGSDRMYLDFKIIKKDNELKIIEIYDPENSL